MFLNILGIFFIIAILIFVIAIIKEKDRNIYIDNSLKRISSESKKTVLFNLPTFFVERVIDGDTIVLQGGLKIRFANIDAYEKNSPMHSRIMNYIVPLIEGKEVFIDIKDRDKYGRFVGTVYTLDGINVNHELVKNGMAVVFDQYCDRSSDEYRALKEAERTAIIYGLGGYGMMLNRPEVDRHRNH